MSEQTGVAQRPWPIFESLRGVSLSSLGPDLLAGLTLAAIAVPEQMATARLGGFAPEVGFMAFIVASVGFAAFGANRKLSAGADSTITPIFAGTIALVATAGSPHYLATAAVLALMVGGLVLLAGLLKLGWVADLLSTPVVTGFLAGIAAHIVLSQAPTVMGLPEVSGDVYHRLVAIWGEIGGVSPASLVIGLGALAITLAAEKYDPRIPGALIALVAASLLTGVLGLDQHGVAVIGHVPAAIPTPRAPQLDIFVDLRLVGLALVVALVVMVQTATTTRAFSDEGEEPDINRDYIGVGAAGLLCGLFGAFPVNASPPRTAVVAETGGRSQFAGLSAAAAVFLLAAFGTPLLAHIPTAALAGILLFVALRIFHVRTFAEILRRTRVEFALAALTTVLIVALPIQTGVAAGIFLSLAHGVFTTTRARPIPFERVGDTTIWWPTPHAHPPRRAAAVLVMGFQAPLSFLNANDFRHGMMAAIARGQGVTQLFVLEASSIVEIDYTASKALLDVIDRARQAGMDFAVARLESVRAHEAFERFDVMERLGPDHLFQSVNAAVQALSRETEPP